MRILTVLTYYRPHTSGLTIYAERLARALARRGHQVTVLTSQFDKSLPLVEDKDGVRIRRIPVLMRISKGVIMPTLGLAATQEIRGHDVLLLHLPQFDASGLALRGRLLKKPTVIIYHSDLFLPPGWFNRFVNTVIDLMNNFSAVFTHRISSYTEDFANHSPYLRRFSKKVRVIAPAVELPEAGPDEVRVFAQKHNPNDSHPVIAMATRFAAEKGVELLLQAHSEVLEKFPKAVVWFAGQYEDVLGEEEYKQRLWPQVQKLVASKQWKFLGTLSMEEMSAFYPNIDLLVVPSTNSTETFGFVQIEAMLNGKPVVAADLPGVRQPVRMTGMGKVTPVGDSRALARNLIEVLSDQSEFTGGQNLREEFSSQICASRHEGLFREIAAELGQRLE